MILPDVNVLLYASRRDTARHDDYRSWLENVVNGEAAYGISPQVLASVTRIGTHRRIYVHPSTTPEALAFCDAILEPEHCTVVQPGPRHWSIFTDLCRKSRATGNLVQDAWLAALAIESGVRVGNHRWRLRPLSRPPLAGAVLSWRAALARGSGGVTRGRCVGVRNSDGNMPYKSALRRRSCPQQSDDGRRCGS